MSAKRRHPPQLLPRPAVVEMATGKWQCVQGWRWRDEKTGLYTDIPAGRNYDGWSVPRILHWFWPPTRNIYVAMVHDAAVIQHGWRAANGIARRAAVEYSETPSDNWRMQLMFDVLDSRIDWKWAWRLVLNLFRVRGALKP